MLIFIPAFVGHPLGIIFSGVCDAIMWGCFGLRCAVRWTQQCAAGFAMGRTSTPRPGRTACCHPAQTRLREPPGMHTFPTPPPCSTRIHTTFVMHTHTHIHRQSCWKEVRTGPLELRRTHFFGPKNVQQNWTFLGPLFFSGCQKERKKTPQGGEHRSGGVKFGANISLTLTQQTNKQASPTNHILPTVGS